jgi:hypothetical protein
MIATNVPRQLATETACLSRRGLHAQRVAQYSQVQAG